MTVAWNGTSDDWTNAAAWSVGSVPTVTDGVIFPDASAYTASVGAGESVGAGSVTVNNDVISLQGATVRIAPGGTLTVAGPFSLGSGTLDLAGTLVGTLAASAFPVPQNITEGPGEVASISTIALPPPATGTLFADGGKIVGSIALSNAALDVAGNNLTVHASDGDPGQVTLNDSTLEFQGTQTFDDADVTLDNGTINSGNPYIVQASDVLTFGPNLHLLATGAGEEVAGGPLVNQGTIKAATRGGSFSIGSDSGAGGGRATLTNLGHIAVTNGDTLNVWGPVAAGNGTGEFDLANGGTLIFHEGLAISPLAGVAAGNTVAFQDGSASVLALDPAHFAATLSGFQACNALDLTASNTQPDDYAASYSAGHIVVSRAGQQVASLATAPGEDYSGAAFVFGTDGNGGATMQIAPAMPVLMTDTATGATYADAASTYTGPYGSLASQFIYGGSHNVAMRATTPDVFLVAGSGTNALAVTSGNNVLSSGAGSAFMVGGSGNDTFFLDGRSGQASWDTVVNFHAGDTVTLRGFTPSVSQISWVDDQGATGYTGATLHVDVAGNGKVDDAVTFAGISRAAASHLALSMGTASGVPYLAISG